MTNNELNRMFMIAHEAGTKRHPRYWIGCNVNAVDVIRSLDKPVDDMLMKTFASVLALRLLDFLQPVGIPEKPTEANIKHTLQKLKMSVG